MNHRTPAEDFRATLAALTREQLEEAMHYLRARDPRAMDRALELVTAPVGTAAQEVTFCTASTDLDGGTLYCDRDAGHGGSHHAPGTDEGSEVAWSDEPAQDEDPPELCDSVLPLPHGGRIKCILDLGHDGEHSALAGKKRWLGTGDDARWPSGIRVMPS